MTKRLVYIDILKGIAILSVIAGHIAAYNVASRIIIDIVYSFHMPLFFFISGFLYSQSTYTNKSLEIKKKLRTLFVPYISISVLGMMVHGFSEESFLGYFTSETRWGYWFLPTLFLLFVFVIILKNRNAKILIGGAFVIEVLSVLLKHTLPASLSDFFLLRHIISYFPFFVWGIFAKKMRCNKILIILSFCCWVSVISLNSYLLLSNELTRTVGRISALYFLFYLFKSLPEAKKEKMKFLAAVGKKSLVIYMFHYFMLPLISQYYVGLNNSVAAIFFNMILSCLIALVCIVLDKHIISRNKWLSMVFLGKV